MSQGQSQNKLKAEKTTVGKQRLEKILAIQKCPAYLIQYPTNNESTCWFTSINHALFHKPRKEIDDIINKTNNENLKSFLQILKNYYQNKEGHVTKEEIQAYRTGQIIKDLFPKQGDKNFEIGGSSFQDANEYFTKLNGLLENFSIYQEIIMQNNENPTKQTNYFLYDILLNKISPNIDFKEKETLVLYFPRMEQKADKVEQIKPLEYEMELLPYLCYREYEFELDAIVDVTTGHYTSYSKCKVEETEGWIKQDGLNKPKIFLSFDDLIKNEKDKNVEIKKKATLLFYTKRQPETGVSVEAQAIQTAVPALSKGSPNALSSTQVPQAAQVILPIVPSAQAVLEKSKAAQASQAAQAAVKLLSKGAQNALSSAKK